MSLSTPRLYHVGVPGVVQSRAFRCIWLLEEIGVDDFEVVMVTPGQPYGPQLKRYGVRHSRKLPTLEFDGREITESGVICQLLAERYADDRSFLGHADERLELLQWIAMAETCITFRIPLLPTLMEPDQDLETIRSGAIEPMRAVFRDNIGRFEEHFEERGSDYLLASGFSAADAMCGWSLHTLHGWGIMDLSTGDSPRTLAYLERLRARPAFIEADRYASMPPGRYTRGCVPVPD